VPSLVIGVSRWTLSRRIPNSGESRVPQAFNELPLDSLGDREVPGHSAAAEFECWSEKPEVDGSTPSLTTRKGPLTWGDRLVARPQTLVAKS
jgi:hypothetical protein